MYKKKIYLGYLKGIIQTNGYTPEADPVTVPTSYQTKYEQLLPVLFDNNEFIKTVHPSYIFRNMTVEELEQEVGHKFPISAQVAKTLPKGIVEVLYWSLWGFDSLYYSIIRDEYKNLIANNKKFIVPIPITNNEISSVDLDKIDLPTDLIEYVRQGNAILYFYQDSEGFLCTYKSAEWFNNFADKFNLNKDNLTAESSNHNWGNVVRNYAKTTNRTIKFKVEHSTEFEDRPWFFKCFKITPHEKTFLYSKFFKFLEHKVEYRHRKKMMCLSRRMSGERAVIFHKIKTTKLLDECTYSSLHNPYNTPVQQIHDFIHITGVPNFKEIQNWFQENFDFQNGVSCDRKDQFINWATDLPEQLHNDTLINVTIETHQNMLGELFFSEKTYKPIFTAQPFIIFGNPNSLKKLKEYGYKTFSDFWDESYDEDVPLRERLNRLFNTMEYIANKPMDELNSWMPDLEPILVHNFNILMNSERIIQKHKKIYNTLYS